MLSQPTGCTQEIYGSDRRPTSFKAFRTFTSMRMTKFRADPDDPDGGGEDGRFMQFASPRTNILPDTEDTRLTVRVLDPGKDRKPLEALVSDRSSIARFGTAA
jgi:hypothetical protein